MGTEWVVNPYAMLRYMPLPVWIKWHAFAEQEPFGPLMDALMAGTISSVVVNTSRSKKSKPVGPANFFPWLKTENQRRKKKSVNPRQLTKKALFITKFMGGRIIDRRH